MRSLRCVRGVSHHGFDLGAWVATHGGDRYVAMLEELAELVNASKIQLDLRTPNPNPLAALGGLALLAEAVSGLVLSSAQRKRLTKTGVRT